MTPDWNQADVDELADVVASGRCVAVLGAGFSAPVNATWKDLLLRVAREEEALAAVRAEIEALLSSGSGAPSSRDYEVAAQLVEDALEPSGETRRLAQAVRRALPRRFPVGEGHEARARVARRAELLLEMPFAEVLTTNFDDLLAGDVLGPGTYERLLRGRRSRWWEERFRADPRQRRVLKLHGDLADGGEGLTLSRRSYRRRLHADPGYLHALRSVFMTRSLLFLGFSFTDEYMNELRSEVLSYLAREDGSTPTLAYALLADVPDALARHYDKHEGIQVFGYDSRQDPDHASFDDFLVELHRRSTPAAILGERLEGRRIMWVDPTEENGRGWQFLARAAEGRCALECARSADEALARLEAGPPVDLVITRWFHTRGEGIRLLEGMRAKNLLAPVVVFASGDHADRNREEALRRGALEYTFHWDTLLEVIDRRFGPPPGAERPRRGRRALVRLPG